MMRFYLKPFWPTFFRAFALVTLAATFSAVWAQSIPNDIQPWNERRLDAVVRIEVSGSVGTGFIIRGKERFFVATSGHVVFGRGSATQASRTCVAVDPHAKLYRRDKDGEQLRFDPCAWQLGSDLTLVSLLDRPEGYPYLELAAREFHELDHVFPAGYPNGYPLDFTRDGRVSTVRTPDNLVVANSLTMEGMSGGPYLSGSGNVVGVHTGGVQYRAGYAHFTAIVRMRASLEAYVGPITEEADDAPTAGSVVSASRREARLGDLLALQIIPDPNTRIVLWEKFIGRTATEEERALLMSLPYSPGPSAENAARLVSLASTPWEPINSNLDLQIVTRLNDVRQDAQLSCLVGDAAIDGDGILRCDGFSKYLPATHFGPRNDPQLVVMHYTANATLKSVVAVFQNNDRPVSAHFLVDRDGSVVQMVPTNSAAYHAGNGRWANIEHLNQRSIGIELVNRGQITKDSDGTFRQAFSNAIVPSSEVQEIKDGEHVTYWHRFTSAQIATAEVIAKAVAARYKIIAVVGHCSIDKRRSDPGPAFPLDEFGQAVLGKGVPDCPAIPSGP
ncbi:hypothetical protein ELH96_20695 [Rhizobium leguminosarum]|nr:hypothetical protein ELH96_20695 [Rhizobium leguminosarum]